MCLNSHKPWRKVPETVSKSNLASEAGVNGEKCRVIIRPYSTRQKSLASTEPVYYTLYLESAPSYSVYLSQFAISSWSPLASMVDDKYRSRTPYETLIFHCLWEMRLVFFGTPTNTLRGVNIHLTGNVRFINTFRACLACFLNRRTSQDCVCRVSHTITFKSYVYFWSNHGGR